jgi:micrococcal nuclease
MIYEYNAKLLRVVDGDTIWLDVNLGFGIHATLDFRLYGINTPEVIGTTKTAGLAAKAELERLLSVAAQLGNPLKIESTKSDKYGRYLAVIHVKQADGTEIDVNEELIKQGHATRYFGVGPKV